MGKQNPQLGTGLLGSFAIVVNHEITYLVCPYVRINKRGFHCTDFREIWYWGLLRICTETPNLVKIGQKYRALYVKT